MNVGNLGLKLQNFLESSCYLPIIETLTLGNIHKEPWTLCSSSMVDELPVKVSSLIHLCHFGESISEPSGIFGIDLANELISSGILISSENGKWSLGGKVIIPYQGLFIFCDFWESDVDIKNDHVWFGGDSTWLTRVLPLIKSKRVLDLCTGTGIQGLVMAAQGNSVTAVDINNRAIEYANLNSNLNNLSDSFEAIQGDLYKPILGKKYDLIIANPPFLPSLNDIGKDVYFINGGTDGERVQDEIIDGLQEYLSQDGEATILSGGFGNSDYPAVTSRLNKYALKNNWKVDLVINTFISANEKINQILKSTADKSDRLAMSADLPSGVTNYYSYLIYIQKDHSPGELNVYKCNASIKDVIKDIRNKKKGLIY